jgi:hypothetical protein
MAADNPPGRTTPDPIYQVVFNLARELWVVKDRQLVLEEVLKEAGIDAAALVDQYQPGDDLTQRLNAERQQLLDRVFLPMESET